MLRSLNQPVVLKDIGQYCLGRCRWYQTRWFQSRAVIVGKFQVTTFNTVYQLATVGHSRYYLVT